MDRKERYRLRQRLDEIGSSPSTSSSSSCAIVGKWRAFAEIESRPAMAGGDGDLVIDTLALLLDS